MKLNKYIYMLMAGATLTACSNEELATNDATGNTAGGNGDSITIETILESDLVNLPSENIDNPNKVEETRSTITSECKVQFEAGDKMYVNDGTLGSVYTLSSTGSTATFKVTDAKNMFSGDLTSKSFFSFYPAEAVRGASSKTVTATVYAEQDYTENNDNTFGGYMASIKNTNTASHASFTYRLVGSVIDVDLSSLGKTPASVSIMANNGETIAGDFEFDTSTGTTINLKSTRGNDYRWSSGSNVVTVNNIDATAFSSNTTIRFYVLPVVLANGLTITVRDTDGNYWTKSTSSTIGTENTDGLNTVNEEGSSTSYKIATPYYKKLKFGGTSTARTGNWMACIPNNVKFNGISLPGSHNSATSSVSGTIAYVTDAANVSRTQDLTIEKQLEAGVRAFDLRPYANSTSLSTSNLYIWHGGGTYTSKNTDVLFVDALKEIQTFLKNNPTETVLVMFHQEKDSPSDAQFTSWQSAVDACINEVKDNVATITSNMNLSAARGKMILISRDDVSDHGTDKLLGKTGWGSSFNKKDIVWGTSSAGVSDWDLYYQDYYDYTTDDDAQTGIDYKKARIEQLYTDYIAKNLNNMNNIYINMCNIAFSFNNTNSYCYNTASRNNNDFVNSTVFTSTSGRWGVMYFDYICTKTSKQGNATTYGQKAFEKVRDHNFDYIFNNCTRIDHTGSSTASSTGATVSGDEYADGTTVYAPRRR